MRYKLLITGGSGFTGRYLAKYAENCGFDVHLLKSNLLDKIELEAEISESRPTHIAHLAGVSVLTNETREDFYNVNVVGTENLLSALSHLKKQVRKIIIASTAYVYGSPSFEKVEETSKVSPQSHYALSKFAMEQLSLDIYRDLPIVILRPFNYTGLGQSANFIVPKLVEKFKARSPEIEIGNIDVCREFNDVRDVVSIYLNLLENGRVGEIYNICSGRAYSIRNIIDMLTVEAKHAPLLRIEKTLLRKNDVEYLSGNPNKLFATAGCSFKYTAFDTIKWMLNNDMEIVDACK